MPTWPERIRDALATAEPPRTIRVAVDETYSVGDEPFPVETGHELGGREDDTRLVVLRLGDVVVVDATIPASLDDETRSELEPHAVPVGSLDRWSLRTIGSFTVAAILQIVGRDLTGTCVVDAGAGEGQISLIAAHCGARPLFLVEHDREQLRRAGRNLARNGLREGADYRLVEADLTDTEGVAAALADVPAPALLASNIGHWPRSYSVSNTDAIALLPHLPAVTTFLAGGYASWASGGGLELGRADRDLLRSLGFHVVRPESGRKSGAMPIGISALIDDERRAFTAERDERAAPDLESFATALATHRRRHRSRRTGQR